MREKTNLTLHPKVKAIGMKMAEEQQISLSELVERLIQQENADLPTKANRKIMEALAAVKADVAELKQTQAKKTR